MSIAIDPYSTTNALGTFKKSSDGYVQGMAMDDPAIRNSLTIGVLASSETLPIWGGLPIQELISINDGAQGGQIKRSTSYATVTGFSVFNQANAWVNSPSSPVPTGSGGATVPFYRMGSKARIVLPIDPALVSLDGSLITAQVSWDFTANRIVAFSTTALPVKVINVNAGNSKVVSWNNTTKLATWVESGVAVALVEI